MFTGLVKTTFHSSVNPSNNLASILSTDHQGKGSEGPGVRKDGIVEKGYRRSWGGVNIFKMYHTKCSKN